MAQHKVASGLGCRLDKQVNKKVNSRLYPPSNDTMLRPVYPNSMKHYSRASYPRADSPFHQPIYSTLGVVRGLEEIHNR